MPWLYLACIQLDKEEKEKKRKKEASVRISRENRRDLTTSNVIKVFLNKCKKTD